jgi:epoxyqueuosine reductase
VNGAALVRLLRERAAALGLGPVGIAAIAPSDHAAALRAWLDHGYAAGMTWMERTARDSADLARRFPWARTAIVAAPSYLPYAGDRAARGGLVPHVARYAVGEDYHRTLSERLEALRLWLAAERPGMEARVYVDTGPVLEREMAARAGLGWFGKSTNIILRGGNSWVLLGEILTSLDLPPDTPAPDRCGSCTACIDACPTTAILAPYVVDSNRCISYLTIEHRGHLPADMEPKVGDWLFGCDVCQEVCPWNRRAAPVDDPAFTPGGDLESAPLETLIRMDEASFETRFGATPLARARRGGMVRNAILVAVNTRHDGALGAVPEALGDPDPVVRGTAARALGRVRGAGARRALERARRTETDASVRRDIVQALD